jgi:hypothetical protein
MPGHFPVLAQTITKSQRSSTIAFEKGFQFNWYPPAFPFKDQNPFRTSCNASHWDIGGLIVRLHCIALGLDQLHPYDGECLRTVHFIDLRSVMEKVNRCFTISFSGKQIVGLWSIIQDLGERLDDLAKQDEQVAGTLSSLTGSMTWNIDQCIWRIRLNPLRTFEKR